MKEWLEHLGKLFLIYALIAAGSGVAFFIFLQTYNIMGIL